MEGDLGGIGGVYSSSRKARYGRSSVPLLNRTRSLRLACNGSSKARSGHGCSLKVMIVLLREPSSTQDPAILIGQANCQLILTQRRWLFY